MGVHLRRNSSSRSRRSRRSSVSSSDGEHRSIASLRAKFENLAHDVKDGGRARLAARQQAQAAVRPSAAQLQGDAAATSSGVPANQNTIQAPAQYPNTKPASVTAPTAADTVKAVPASLPSTLAAKPQASSDHPSQYRSQVTSSAPVSSTATRPLPIASRYSSKSPMDSSPASSLLSGQQSSGGRSLTSTSGPSAAKTEVLDEEDTAEPSQFSVASLRERFGRSAAPSSSSSGPSHSRRPSIEAFLQPSRVQVEPQTLSTNMVSLSPPPPAPPSNVHNNSSSAPLEDTPERLQGASPLPPPKPAPALPPKPQPSPRSSTTALPVVSRQSSGSSEPQPSIPAPSQKRGPAPPPPASRSASPAVTDGRSLLSASSNQVSRVASPVHRPAPAPPLRSTSPQPPVSVPPSTPAKPPLPVRKATLPAPAEIETIGGGVPPLPPARRPSATPSPNMLAASYPEPASSVPPPLPGNKPSGPTFGASAPLPIAASSRARAQTVSKIQNPTSLSPRPPLPVRQSTIGTSPVPPGPSMEMRKRTQSISGDGGFYLPPPPPTRTSDGAGLKRNQTFSAGRMHGQGHVGSGSSTPPKRNGSGESDDDDEGAAPPLTTMAQRLLDEHPVSTDANRRPPHFTPDIRITSAHSISAFAVWGQYACVAHSHVKVYDTTLGSQILEIDQHKDTGLEVRAKEPRITALGFRPAKEKADEGRFLWCGTKDGHIFEVDIKLGAVTHARSSVHGAAVTHIMRHQGWVITLDEVGKIHVWELLPGEDDDGSFKISRTLRISDKLTFAKMIKGRLWTATAPAVRSTTNAAGARGPTVRVYDICARGSAPPPLTALTSEWTGAATSATILPEEPEKIYLGHEGGFVSIWSIDNERLECVQVLKASTTDIVALEGADKHLWAGNRRGDIHVWNLQEKPWRTSNIWTAHPEQAIHSLTVDPFGIESSGRFIVWSFSRDDLHGWDGLRGVNWIDKRMVERQPDYCDFRQVRVLVVSWNIDSAKPTDLSGSAANLSFLHEALTSVESPDIIVFGFQETIPLTDKKLTAKTLLFGSKGRDGGGATSDRVSGAYRAWAESLSQAVGSYSQGGATYSKVQSEQLVGLFTCMFVKTSERDCLRDVNITTVKRGIGGIYGNKGAIVARMVIDDTSMCFINVHLAAGQKHKATRNADIAAIMEDKVVFPPADKLPYVHGGDGTGILDHEMVVLNGDLNYRIDQRRDTVVNCIATGDLSFLLEHDQLRREMRGNHAFRLRSFAEAPIEFNPTYKFDRGTDEYDTSDKRRIPAWCDRVLFTKTPRITPISYRSYAVSVSDHKPVSAGLAIEIKRIDPTRMREVYRETLALWRQHETKRLEVMIKAYAGVY